MTPTIRRATDEEIAEADHAMSSYTVRSFRFDFTFTRDDVEEATRSIVHHSASNRGEAAPLCGSDCSMKTARDPALVTCAACKILAEYEARVRRVLAPCTDWLEVQAIQSIRDRDRLARRRASEDAWLAKWERR